VDALKLPEQLIGPWRHALILTYGINIPFFENALWSQFNAGCRNKIILGDGRCYLEACASYAESGLARHINQRYVADGIFSSRAAHAKVILLTNSEQGRLLVGSGNLGLSGYASPGELFTRYEYYPEWPETLPAFQAVRELLEGLITSAFIGDTAVRHVELLLSETPWLYHNTNIEWRPVRHNLQRPFLDQLAETVADEPVEELWVLAPFYDEDAQALGEMLRRLRPQQTKLLVQPGSTSVKPDALERTIATSTLSCQVRAFASKDKETSYFHAKLYLLKLPGRAICLQGSPNLSRVALLRTVPQGNIEVANLLSGPRDSFDYLLDPLLIDTATLDIHALGLSYQKDRVVDEEETVGWRLISGEWLGQELRLRFQGILPDLDGANLNIGGALFPLQVAAREAQRLTLLLSPEATTLLQRPVPLSLEWGEARQRVASNPIFVSNRASLNATIEASDDEKIGRVGDLDLDDEELEQLVGELEAHLVIDRCSVWQVAGRRSPTGNSYDDDEALRLDYADVDYEMLRRHPRLQQYTAIGRPGSSPVRTRLQLILRSITDHFQGLVDVASGKVSPTAVLTLEESDAQTEAEREAEETEKEQRRWSQAQRLRSTFKHFIGRYLQGIRSPDFQELAGYEVMVQNTRIFSHLLWALFQKDWFEPDSRFVIESLLKTWRFFWESSEGRGYLAQLDQEAQREVLHWLREQHADAQLLAGLYQCGRLTRTQKWQELRFELRDFWRGLLTAQPFPITSEVLEETWYWVADLYSFQPPRPTEFVDELCRLARFEIEHGFLRALEARHGYPSGSCAFERVKVRRESFANAVTVKCLSMQAGAALIDEETAVAVLQAWMQFEKLDYYRLAYPDANAARRLVFYEVADSSGVYWDKDGDLTPVELAAVLPSDTQWNKRLHELRQSAARLNQDLTLRVTRHIDDIAELQDS
jgi:hypothetical protein